MNHNPAEALITGHGHGPLMHAGMANGGGPPPPGSGPGTPLGGPGSVGGGGNGNGGGNGGSGGGGGGGIIGVPLNGGHVRFCAGCGGKIIDRFLLHALDGYWHTACLKCSCCGATLADIGSSCFTRAGMILCKNDYIRMFGNTGACTSCGQVIPASEFVMRTQGNVYHLKCFACVKCHHRLVTGDRYNVINGNLLCEQDCHKFLKGAITATGPGTGRKTKISRQDARQNKMAKAAAMSQISMDLNQGAFI